MKKIASCILGVVAIIVLIIIDRITKNLAVINLKDTTEYSVIDGIFSLHYLENHGAAFGILQNKQIIFYIITIIIVFVAAYIYFKLPSEKRYFGLRVIIVFIIAGALGNFIDRITQQYVVDFFYFKAINFPVFNVADIYVTGGAIAFIVLLIFYYKEDDFKRIFGEKKKRTTDYTNKGF